MKKLIFLIAIALVLSACNSNSPHAKELNDLEKKYNAHIGDQIESIIIGVAGGGILYV